MAEPPTRGSDRRVPPSPAAPQDQRGDVSRGTSRPFPAPGAPRGPRGPAGAAGPGPVLAGVCPAGEGPAAAGGSTSRDLKPGPGGGEACPGGKLRPSCRRLHRAPGPLGVPMTLNTQRGSKSPLRRRASTPLPQPGVPGATPRGQPCHPQLGHTASEPGGRAAAPRGSWSSESSGSSVAWEPRYRVVLLGDPGVGKSSLANVFAGVQERDPPEQHRGGCLAGRGGWLGTLCYSITHGGTRGR